MLKIIIIGLLGKLWRKWWIINIFCCAVKYCKASSQREMLKSTGGCACVRAGVRASTYGFRSIVSVCCDPLTPNLKWVAYFKSQLMIPTQVSVIKIKVTVANNRKSDFHNLSLLSNWTIDAKLSIWVDYIKRQLGIATNMSVIKVSVTFAKIETK